MYEYITGKMIDKEPNRAVIESNGIGYKVNIPVTTYEELPEKNERVKLLLSLHVREDAQKLYGFYTEEERKLFELLKGISRIGSKKAISMLSGAPPSEFKRRIVTEDIKSLTTISGIGKKTAKRIIMELGEKIEEIPGGEEQSEVGSTSSSASTAVNSTAVEALEELGYSKNAAKKAVLQAIKQEEDSAGVQKIIKVALNIV